MTDQNNAGKTPEQLSIDQYANNNNKDPLYEQYLKEKANFDAYMASKNAKKDDDGLGFTSFTGIEKLKEQTKKELEHKFNIEKEFNKLLSNTKSKDGLWELSDDIINEAKIRYHDNLEKGIDFLKFHKVHNFVNKNQNENFLSEEEISLWNEWKKLSEKEQIIHINKFYPIIEQAEKNKKLLEKKNMEYSFMGIPKSEKGAFNRDFYKKHPNLGR